MFYVVIPIVPGSSTSFELVAYDIGKFVIYAFYASLHTAVYRFLVRRSEG